MTNLTRIPIFVVLLMFAFIPCFAQHSFELKFGEANTNNSTVFSFEFQDFYYVAGAKGISEGILISSSAVYKISKTGEVIAQSSFPKADSNYALHFGFPKKNGNLLFMGILADTVNSYLARYTYLCELTPDLEMVWETIDAIPSPPVDTTRHYPRNFLITPEEEIIIQGTVDTVRYGYNDLLYLTKYDMQGNRLQFHLYPSWKDHGLASELLFNADSTGFYLIGALSLNSISKDWIEFDLELNLLSSGTLTDENSLLWSPISVVRLDNGNIVIANQLAEFDNWYSYGVEMRLYSTEFELLKTSIYYTEKTVYTPLKRGIGHVNDSCIWVAAFENNPTGILGKEDIIFLVYDSELNLLGEKIHQGDRRYWILDLLPCSDSGCLIAGIVAEYEGADWADNYLLKVQLHDVVTSTIEHFNPDQRIAIHPIPAKDRITLTDVPESSVLLLYTPTGQLAASFKLEKGVNQLEIGHLTSGMYFASILQNQQLIQTSKILKQ